MKQISKPYNIELKKAAMILKVRVNEVKTKKTTHKKKKIEGRSDKKNETVVKIISRKKKK